MALDGRKVLIVGGSAGIGRATAHAAAVAGAHVVIFSRSEEKLAAAAETLPGSVETHVLDVRHFRGMDRRFEEAAPFDHLVVTAAEVSAVPFLEVDLEQAKHAFDTKFWGQFAAAQCAAAFLNEGGSITLFSGVAADKPVEGLSVAAAMNGAVEALVRSLALELSPIRVNAVSPGVVDTHGVSAERRRELAARLPVQRVGDPEQVADAVLFLMENDYTTGTTLVADGGYRLV